MGHVVISGETLRSRPQFHTDGSPASDQDRPVGSAVLISNVLFSLSVPAPVYASCG